MYKTIRMLPALLLLLGTACTNDLADNPAATGLPLVLEDVYIGTQTKAEPIETTAFEERDQLTATLTLGDVTSTGTYTYKNGKWETTTPAYWQNTTEEHTVTLRTPEPNPAMPDAFTADNWHLYDVLEYSQTTKATTSFTLAHTRAQLIVTLKAGKGLEDADLSGATVKAGNSQLWHRTDQGAYYALLDPNEPSPALTITCNGETYTYDYHISLYANQCTLLALTLHKTGVSGISITSQPWEGVTATTTIDDTFTQIDCDGTDNITIPDNATKLLITGTLTEANVTAINNAKDQITHLYITATAEDEVWEELSMDKIEYTDDEQGSAPSTGEGGDAGEVVKPGPNETLQSICFTQATSIGENAFKNCRALKNATLPKVASIGSSAFYGSALTTISLPAATTIGDEAFDDCDALTTISLPAATTIGINAFNGCTSLTSISLSKNAKDNIGEDAFYGCDLLTTLHLLDLTAEEFEADPDTYTSFGGHDWQHIYYNGGEWHRDANN